MKTKRKRKAPAVGTRVMRPYGCSNYVTYGEIGTVTAHNGDGTFQMTLDAEQPFYRTMWGAKAKITDHGGMVHEVLTPTEVEPLVAVYRENARRLRVVADNYANAARDIVAEQKASVES